MQETGFDIFLFIFARQGASYSNMAKHCLGCETVVILVEKYSRSN